MSSISVYKERNTKSTTISNLFIDEYMTGANAVQLKVYLYLLRAMECNQDVSVSTLADRFNETEGDIIRSLKYRENIGLLGLDFDPYMNLTGIKFIDPEELRESRKPATIVPLNLSSYDSVPSKHVYSASEMKELRSREDIRELVFVAETYLGRPLKPSDLQTLLYISEDLHFPKELVDFLIEYCVDRGTFEFKHIENLAKNWFSQNIHTVKQAEKITSKYDKLVLNVMEALGRTTSPTPAESDYVYRWSGEYGFSKDLILEACNRASLNVESGRFKYVEGILSNWKKDGISRKDQLSDYDNEHKNQSQGSKSYAATNATQHKNKFNQHIRTSYDYEALEREILSN